MSDRALLHFVGVFVLLQLIHGASGWGKEGHYAVCKIAEGYLTEDALAAVKKFLPVSAEGDLAAVCSWPDEIRRQDKSWQWSGPLHYINTPEKCNYGYCRDCHDSAGNKDVCVAGAIFNYTMQLKSANKIAYKYLGKYNLTEALMFLSHFMGDIHQPLHVSFSADQGGNTIKLFWYGQLTDLHHVWDSSIIESAMKKFYKEDLSIMIEAIQRKITEDWSSYRSAWEKCGDSQIVCPNLYASESINLACKFAYKNALPRSRLGGDYFHSRLPIVEKRIAQGGLRLAATLNRIFASKTKTSRA